MFFSKMIRFQGKFGDDSSISRGASKFKKIFLGITSLFLISSEFAGAMLPSAPRNDRREKQEAKVVLSAVIRSESLLYKYVNGNVVMLVGVSSSGKTSIAKQAAYSINNRSKLYVTGTDTISDLVLRNFIKRKLPSKIYKKLHRTVGDQLLVSCASLSIGIPSSKYASKIIGDSIPEEYRECFFSSVWNPLLSELSEIPNEEYFSAMIRCIDRQLMPALSSGVNAIVDAVSLAPFFVALERNFIKCRVNTVVVYCPPQKVLEHIVNRNFENICDDPGEIRLFFPFFQYQFMYEPTDSAVAERIPIRKDEFSVSLKNAVECSSESAHIKLFLEDLSNISSWDENSKKELLENWYLGEKTEVFIKPKVHYDMLINTEKTSPSEAFQMIRPMLHDSI